MTPMANGPKTPPADGGNAANAHVWADDKDIVAELARRDLRPAEVIFLVRYRDALGGRVLEIGCGAGRLTGYLAEFASSLHAFDISATLVAYCRERYPSVSVEVGDMTDLSQFETSSFDVVVAGFNVLDYVSDEVRRSILREIGRLLTDGGLLIMSSHNRSHAADRHTPVSRALADRRPSELARRLVQLPGWLSNRRHLRPFEREEDDYALLVDSALDFRLLHYYIDRDAQERQLQACGFELLECLDNDGRLVPPSAQPPGNELHYAARALKPPRALTDERAT